MSATDLDAIVEDYFKRLDAALSPLPRARREELKAEITEHLNEARSTNPNETEVGLRELLDRVGPPEDIAAAALADEHPRRRRKTMIWLVSAVALVAAAVALTVVLVQDRHSTRPLPKVAPAGTITRRGDNTAFQVIGLVRIPIDHTGRYSWTGPALTIPAGAVQPTGVPEHFAGGWRVEGNATLQRGIQVLPVSDLRHTRRSAFRVTFNVTSFSGKPTVVVLGANISTSGKAASPQPNTATCGGVTFPIQTVTAPACASFGKPVELGWVRVTLGNLRAVTVGSPGQLGRDYFCGKLTLMNTAGQSHDYGDRYWSTASISSHGDRITRNAAHAVLPDALRFGTLTPGGRASGSVCFAGTANDFPGHLVVTWLAPDTGPVKSAAWVGVVPTRPSRSDRAGRP